jgi:hypothetical protein
MPTQLVHAALVITNQHLDRSKVIGRVAVYGLEYKSNTYDPETIMADSVDPFPLLTQGIDQTRKAMESYLDFFQKTMKAPPLLDANLNQKMKTYMEQNIAAVSQFAQEVSKAKDLQNFWRVQSEFTQAQWKAFTEQAKELTELATKVRRM